MTAPSHLPLFAAVLLLAAAPFAMAQSTTEDPVAPAVIGRPLDQIRPARPVRQKPPAPKPERLNLVAASSIAAAPIRPAPPPAAAPVAAQSSPAELHPPKQALDDRADPNERVIDNVGKGPHLASKPLPPGAYLGARAQAVVRSYYQAHPGSGKPSAWKIGEPVPPKAKMTGVPGEVRAALPRVPPGTQYVELDGEVVLVAVGSRMVVDGVSRNGS